MLPIESSEISTAAPFYNLLPALVAGLSFFFLGEILQIKQILGIGIIIFGAYILEVDHKVHNLLDPFKKIFKSKYILLLFIVLFLL